MTRKNTQTSTTVDPLKNSPPPNANLADIDQEKAKNQEEDYDFGEVEILGEEDEDLLPEMRDATAKVEEEEEPEGLNMPALRSVFKPQGVTTDMSADPLTVYLSHIRNHPILDAETQQELAKRYVSEGDKEAAQILILSNLRLVVKIAREYRRRWTNMLELIQEGNVGLSEAIQRYDPYRHVKFTSYAQYWIRAMILNYLMNHFQPIRIGSTRAGRKLFYNLKKARAQLQAEGHNNPTPALIAEKLGVSERDVIDVSRHLDQPAMSIDQNAPGYENVSVGELLEDRETENPEDAVARVEFYDKVKDIMDEFVESLTDPRDVALWTRRLMAVEPVTLSELGTDYGVSKERIRQVEARLKERFKVFISQRLDGDIATLIDV